ncbi:hypothetical protein Tco_0525468 [Tanacetum coccineum]
MDGRGSGSYVMFGSVPSGPSFSVSLSVKLSVVGRGGDRKGGSCVLIPDLVVMAKVGASGFGVSLLLIVKSIWEYCSLAMLDKHIPYPFCVRLLFKHEVGELVLKLTFDNPFWAILLFSLRLLFPHGGVSSF